MYKRPTKLKTTKCHYIVQDICKILTCRQKNFDYPSVKGQKLNFFLSLLRRFCEERITKTTTLAIIWIQKIPIAIFMHFCFYNNNIDNQDGMPFFGVNITFLDIAHRFDDNSSVHHAHTIRMEGWWKMATFTAKI